jgi:methylthioribose-1-phosphate isomerase
MQYYYTILGAPLIAIVALLGLSVDLHTNTETITQLSKLEEEVDDDDDVNVGSKILGWIREKMAYLKSSRPTAVNLSNALDEVDAAMVEAMTSIKNNHDATTSTTTTTTKSVLLKAILDYSEFMLERDVSDNRAIGKFGAEMILATVGKETINLVTICNTGSLATAGYGTALGVARYLHEMNQLESISALETRPYNQGSRLTAFEILQEGMPGGQLICDSAAGALMQVRLYISLVFRSWYGSEVRKTLHKMNLHPPASFCYHNQIFFHQSSLNVEIDPNMADQKG